MRLVLKFLLVGSLFVTGTSTILADTFSPSMCQPASATDASSLRYLSSELTNSGSRSIGVQCPVVRENITNRNGTRMAFIVVQSNGSQQLRCQLSSKTRTGASIQPTTESVGIGFTSRAFPTSLNLDVDRSTAFGTYGIFCRIPPGGKILSYTVTEF